MAMLAVVLAQPVSGQQVVGKAIWDAMEAAAPQIGEYKRALFWFETQKAAVGQLRTVGIVTGWSVNVHVHEAEESGSESATAAVFDAIIQIDAKNRVRSLIAGQSKLNDERTRRALEAEMRASSASSSPSVVLARVFAAFPPDRVDQARQHLTERLDALAPDLGGVRVQKMTFGVPDPDSRVDPQIGLMWYGTATGKGCEVDALMEPIIGTLVSVHIACEPR